MKHKRTLFAVILLSFGQIGSAYDFFVYPFLSHILASNFFPSQSTFLATCSVFVIFFVGFLARPVGGFIFGRIGDITNAKNGTLISILSLALPTILIGCLPTYTQIGVLAPLALLLLRIFQGLAVGGEFTGIMILLNTIATKERKNFYTSFCWVGSFGGTLFCAFFISQLSNHLTHTQMLNWGWRIPFLLSSLLLIISHAIKTKVHGHSDDLEKKYNKSKPIPPFYSQIKNSFPPIFLLTLQSAALTYFVIVYLPNYLITHKGILADKVFLINSVALLGLIFLVPILARIADNLPTNLPLGLSSILLLLTALLLLPTLKYSTILEIYLLQAIFIFITSLNLCVLPLALLKLTPMKYRYTSLSIPFNLSVSLIGGSLPLLITLLTHWSNNLRLVGVYFALLAILSALPLLPKLTTAR